MSPLIYSDSDGSEHGDNTDIENSPSINSQRFTPDIVCNQEHAAKTKANARNNAKRHTTPVKRALRPIHDRVSPSKRLNYKQLPIEIRSSSCALQKPHSFRSKKQNRMANSTEVDHCESLSKMTQSHRLRSISSTSDIQIISQADEKLSPIVISASSDDFPQASQMVENTNGVSCASPDLFNSFSSTKSDALSQKQHQNVSRQTSVSDSPDVANDGPLRDVFGAPDECDDIDLLSNTNVDIFEITKNSVFDNVLCSANDRITPFKNGTSDAKTPADNKSSPNPNVSCLSGLRLMLSDSGSGDVRTACSVISTKQLSPNSVIGDDDVVDLTALESQKIIEISSEDSFRDIQKTPERKQQLTPSTRSCLKRQTDEEPNSDERKSKTPRSKSGGWITRTKSTSPKSDTPKSRHRLDKWKQRTDILNMQTTRPRNLFDEFKSTTPSRSGRITARRNMPSTSTAKSPIIFSDQE